MNNMIWTILPLFLTGVHAEGGEERKTSPELRDIVLVLVGLTIFVASTVYYIYDNCMSKEIVEFESFEAANPTPTTVVSDVKAKQMSTFSTEAMREASFENS